MKLTAYIQGERHGKEANRIERKAMRDPFLQDAIDGFDAVGDNHAERIADMRRRLSQKTVRTNHRMTYALIAAALLTGIIAGGYFIFNRNTGDFVAKNEAPANEVVFDEQPAAREELPEAAPELPEREDAGTRQSPDHHHEEAVETEPYAGAIIPESKKISPAKEAEEAVEITPETTVEDELPVQEEADAEQSPEEEAAGENINEPEQSGKASEPEKARALNDAAVRGYGTVKSATEREKRKPVRLETPEPKTGWKAYRKYLKEALRRPSDEECSGAKGTVEVTFHIDREGVPYDFVIGKSVCPSADTEAIRLVKEGSLWTCESYRRMKVEVKF
ncbi:MAG: hypothetical protein LBL57_01370 [Tannerella sp.]|jgi:outer membrane biosynthesis protein TonB|nr:hypothetical protein [Tannerella sp.]